MERCYFHFNNLVCESQIIIGVAMDLLERARKYEKEKEVEITKEERPVFHLSPRVGE